MFDSGVGGLTVLRALRAALPAQDFIYLGDTARLPYGTKSPQTVVRYSLQCARRFGRRGIRLSGGGVQYRIGVGARRVATRATRRCRSSA